MEEKTNEKGKEIEKEGEVTSMKKGLWTMEEDAVLKDYVTRLGDGKWNVVKRNCGLTRDGKSCRLRWNNHLRPHLKKGPFSPEEERIVVELHSQIGNRWTRMSSKLPRRSDNEIKNFWNIRTKRLKRAMLPLYPDRLTSQRIPSRYHDQNLKTPLPSPCENNFSNLNEIRVPPLASYCTNIQNAEFELSPELSMGPFSYCVREYSQSYENNFSNLNPAHPDSSFPDYSYPRNENDCNINFGSNSDFPPLSAIPSSSDMGYPNFQTILSPAYPLESQSKIFDLNPNPQLSVTNYFTPQNLFSNSDGGLSSIQSLLGTPPAVCEPTNGENLPNLSTYHDPQYNFAPVYTNDDLLEDICGACNTMVPNGIMSGKGKEICIWGGDCGRALLIYIY